MEPLGHPLKTPRFLAWLLALGLATGGCGGGGGQEITVTMSDFAFEPRDFPIQAGQKTTIALQNKGAVEHNFTVAQLNVVSPNVPPQQAARVELAAPRGTYKVVCTIPGHEEAGMVGQVTVVRR